MLIKWQTIGEKGEYINWLPTPQDYIAEQYWLVNVIYICFFLQLPSKIMDLANIECAKGSWMLKL